MIDTEGGTQTISRYIYGHFFEHLGRCIYDGLWVGKNSTIPNINGFRPLDTRAGTRQPGVVIETSITYEQIELWRDRTYHRTPQRQVRDIPGALRFVNETGFCFAFTARRSELPCLWHAACGERHPLYPEHTHSDPFIGLVWQAKDELPARRALYYGKAIKKRPSMISLEYLPAFYRLIATDRSEDRYIADYMAGRLSPAAKRIMDALSERSPQITAELKLSSGCAHPRKRAEFDRGMAELQMGMHLCKIAEFYDPFTFLWDRFTSRYQPEVEAALELSPEQARLQILQQFFRLAGAAADIDIQRLFAWSLADIGRALEALAAEGLIHPVRVENQSNRKLNYFCFKSFPAAYTEC